MDPERWKRIDQIFHAVLDHKPSERAKFLAEACKGDDSLRIELERLIARHEEKSNLFDRPPSDLAAALLTKQDASLDTISHYRILKKIGRGGMGEVYLAEDTRLNRKVALKLLPLEFTKDKERIRRFEREARAISALNHPNILTIYDIGQAESSSFIASEYIEGETLRQRMQISKMPLNEILTIIIQVAEALDAAHQAGVIHRDIKPENIMLRNDGYVKILDFGLAKLIQSQPNSEASDLETQTRTQTGVVIGTFRYMSPEQARGLNVDARTDIFSLGVVLLELIAGHNPFDGATPIAVIAAILEKHPLPLRTFGEFPEELQWIVTKALAKEIEERYQSVKDMLTDLKRIRKRLELEEELKGSVAPKSVTIGGLTFPSELSLAHFIRSRFVWLCLLGLVAVGILVYFLQLRPKPFHSLAILPFVNASQNPETEYLSDGITESIINSMSQLSNLRVMSRSTVFSYKDKKVDPRKVGMDLKVQAVVTGRVIQHGESLVIQADLVSVQDGVQLWGEQFHRKLSDVLSVQDEISKEIATKLRFKLTGEQTKRLTKHYTENAKAYQFYLKGMYHVYKSTEDDYEKARDHFQQAIEIDPAYALAYAGISRYYGGMIMDGYRSPKEMWPKVEAAAKKALEIDKTLTHGKFQIAVMKFYRDWDWPESERIFREIIEDDPTEGFFYHQHSFVLMVMGRKEEAIQQIKKCESLDPLSPVFSVNVGQFLSMSGRLDEAIQQLRKTIELNPDYETAVFSLVDVYQRKGSYDEAIEASERGYRLLEDESTAELFAQANGKEGYQKAVQIILRDKLNQYLEISQERYVSPLDIASIYSQLHETNEAFLWLEKAFEERSGQLVFLNLKADWDPLRSDPRFTELTKRIGLP